MLPRGTQSARVLPATSAGRSSQHQQMNTEQRPETAPIPPFASEQEQVFELATARCLDYLQRKQLDGGVLEDVIAVLGHGQQHVQPCELEEPGHGDLETPAIRRAKYKHRLKLDKMRAYLDSRGKQVPSRPDSRQRAVLDFEVDAGLAFVEASHDKTLDVRVDHEKGGTPPTVKRSAPARVCLLYTSPSPRDS